MKSIALNKLVPSTENVRLVNPGKASDKELIASIEAIGLLQNLTVSAGKGGQYKVHAGARRLSALKHLSKAGKIAKDHKVPCKELPKASNVTEVSLVENTHRVAMHPADEFAAFSTLIDGDGMDLSAVAERFGKSRTHVKQRLSLGRVNPKLLNDYRKGKLNLDAIMAFTLSEDHERQLVCYKELSKNHRLQAHHIKNWLEGESVCTGKGIGRFVGKAAYVKAGGAMSTDLFEDVVYLSDTALVSELALKKLKGEAQTLKAAG